MKERVSSNTTTATQGATTTQANSTTMIIRINYEMGRIGQITQYNEI